ncbi:unnamed protein product [Linum trigynum]|uniref:Uncharacterized protein n=1 Tax=Linum trigynum TaxID=586398 RepID=A0AAV2D9K9_9ROSI
MVNGKSSKGGPGGSRFTSLAADEVEEDIGTGRTKADGSNNNHPASFGKGDILTKKSSEGIRGNAKSAGGTSGSAGRESGKKTMTVDSNKQTQPPNETVTLVHPTAEGLNVPVKNTSMKEPPRMPASTQSEKANNGVQPMEPNAMQRHHVRPPDSHSQQVESSGNLALEKTNESIIESLVNEASSS